MLKAILHSMPHNDYMSGRIDGDAYERIVERQLQAMIDKETDPVVKGMLMAAETIFIHYGIEAMDYYDTFEALDAIDSRIDSYLQVR